MRKSRKVGHTYKQDQLCNRVAWHTKKRRFAIGYLLIIIYTVTRFYIKLNLYLPTNKLEMQIKHEEKIEHKEKHNCIAIIGGAGYIGSFLGPFLQMKGFEIVIFDKNIHHDVDLPIPSQTSHVNVIEAHSRNLDKKDLARFGTVVFLGGCTGRKACDELTTHEVEIENVSNVIDIMKKLDSSQHFIAASTSAVTEGTFSATEDSPIHSNLLDSYSLSMFKREIRLKEFVDHDQEQILPKISLLRFGTVVGNSPSQRTDLMIPSFFLSAYTTGYLKIAGHNTMRSFLTLEDLSNAFVSIISKTNKNNVSAFDGPPSPTTSTTGDRRYDVWNLASFDATVFKVASTVSSLTGAIIESNNDSLNNKISPLLSDGSGFSLNCTAFETTFNFKFHGSLENTIHDFDIAIPNSIIAKGPHRHISNVDDDIVACPVCGATGQQIVLDLGSQPLANDFSSDVNIAITKPRFPLKLVRCRVCNHYHLSHIVDRSDLFEHYLYQSGTSSTLSEYFEWLARKVIKESNLDQDTPGSILEIACNDGSQLDHFKSKGWKTFGVDPASNLVRIAALNHTVKNGFWPTNFPSLPTGNDLTAITAQNVAAHVPDVVSFLKGCADVMGSKTKLYIQTSQCNMQQLGQFDTVYHEHISFFTGHSFAKAAELSGLVIESFETTPIHGESCLVTMQLANANTSVQGTKAPLRSTMKSGSTSVIAHGSSPSLTKRLIQEEKDGITSEVFALKFSAHAHMIREWMRKELLGFKAKGFVVGGYGAAAKGMVLLHYIIGDDDNGSSFLDFVLDDAKLKQGTFCPGTVLPVKATSSLLDFNDSDKKLVITVFAWNFFDEIAAKIISLLQNSHDEVIFLVPFPSPRVLRVDLKVNNRKFVVLREFAYNPTPIPNPITHDENRTKAVMVTHFRNEELLLPFFIMHHASMFDKVILIDFESDDHSLEIIDRFAPVSWEVVKSSTGSVFDAAKTDEQVESWEKLYPDDWIIALTVTEFLIGPHIRQYLQILENEKEDRDKPFVSSVPCITINGNNTEPLVYSESLPKQRHVGTKTKFYNRYLHYKTSETYKYGPGRHVYEGEGAEVIPLDLLIMKFGFAPWPEVKERKMNVGQTIPKSDTRSGYGKQHTRRGDVNYLNKEYFQSQKNSLDIDLCSGDDKSEAHVSLKRIYHQLFGKCH